MIAYQPYLAPIAEQYTGMVALLRRWVEIPSGSDYLEGLGLITQELLNAFSVLNGSAELIPLPPREFIDRTGKTITLPQGHALHIVKNREAPIQVFLGGHMDTVYQDKSLPQPVEFIGQDLLKGPGVADMKGGLVVMLKALQAFESSPFSGQLGWEVLINPDEECGSTSSKKILSECAKRNDIGLLFEPAHPDGSIVRERKGSANFVIIVRGKAAHAGRDFSKGRNAITALARLIVAINLLNRNHKNITINVGHIEGGGAPNVIPDFAICRLNIRFDNKQDLEDIQEAMARESHPDHYMDGIHIEIHKVTERLPKPFSQKTRRIYEYLQECAADLGCTLESKPSGGVCDGNLLAVEGLPNLDTLGVVGGHIHSSNEYCFLPSLPERAALTAYFLMRIANEGFKLF